MNTNKFSKTSQVLIFAASYLAWFGCVFSGKYKLGVLVYLIPLLFLFFSFRIFKIRWNGFLIFLVIALLGVIFDLTALHQHWITVSHRETNGYIPDWLIALWFLFSFSTPLYSSWLQNKKIFASVLGFFIGPLTYYSGSTFDVLEISDKLHLLYYGLFWAAFFPFTISLNQKFISSASLKE